MNDNPVGGFLADLRSSPALKDAVEWLREPPGLYVAVAVVVGVLVLFVLRLLAGSAKGQQRAAERKLNRQMLGELKSYKEMQDWRGAGEVYERMGDQKNALKFYQKGGHAREAASLLRHMGERSQAKSVLEAAGLWEELAKMCMDDREYKRAGTAFEKGGKTLSAAEAYELAGDSRRAARLYEQGGMESKAGELLAEGGGREAAELLEKDIRRQSALAKGANMPDEMTARLQRAVELWVAEGEADRAFRLISDCEQWRLAPKVADMLPPTAKLAEACTMGGAPLAAADIWEKLGDKSQAALLRAQHHQQRNELIEAARWFEEAEEWVAAADIHYGLGKLDRAAELYDKGGDARQAAEMWAAAGESAKAAALYAQVGEFDMAAAAFADAGDVAEQSRMLAQAGDYLRAGALLKERGLLDKAIESLQKVAPDQTDYHESRVILGEIFLDKGDRPAARAALERAVEGRGLGPDTVPAYYNLARLLESEGKIAEAKRMYEQVNAEKYGYRDVAMRLKAIADGRPISGTASGSMGPTPPHMQVSPAPGAYDRTVASEIQSSGGGTALSEPHLSQVGGVQGRYELGAELGRGGMGVVYRAEDRTLKRNVAYKALPADLRDHPKAAQNLLAEARSAAQLSHPNIVQVYDAGKDERGYFIVMELVEGETFDRILRERRISVSGVTNIGRQICAALSHAHSKRIVHRDLKPSNLFWTKDKLVKLMDFGLARAYDESVGAVKTRTAGTPYYMAPEQIRGDAVSPRTDIYALGCVLYELLCNRPPFTEGELSYHHVHTTPESPRKFREDIPEGLAQVVLKCIAKDPEERYGSAEEVSKALATFK